ncbi:alpha/beta hydrolase [Niabella aquatica]
MEIAEKQQLVLDTMHVQSKYLKREVELRLYAPEKVLKPAAMSLLLINDGQDMPVMNLAQILSNLYAQDAIAPVLCAAITAGAERMQEYGVAGKKDYLGRGAKAGQYAKFILNELLPFIKKTCNVPAFKETAFAGFSLGGLSALDIVWNHADIFSKVGVFSGSLWWRSIDQNDKKYNDHKHRIMQQQIRRGKYAPGLRFFFECGRLDESGDRNNNGIIDSIDDTLDHIKELLDKGYSAEDIFYLELADGKHDVTTWGEAMPVFLKWGWGEKVEI